jgi:hypothetical protein
MRRARRAHSRARVNIISWDSGGLGTDIDVLTAALAHAECEIAFKGRKHRRPRSRFQSLMMSAAVLAAQKVAALTKSPPFDINIFLESVFPEYLPLARVNWLLANPEWFRKENEAYLQKLACLLCKTPSAVSFFEGLGVALRCVGFSSPDRRIEGSRRAGPLRCLHLSGASALKGTEAVVEVWRNHPEWPELTVVRRERRYGGEEAPPLPSLPNVRYEGGYLSDSQLRALQNASAVHVQPSQAEGYGHVIGEGMSCGVVVVTTDAPPMNELVGTDRGVLVRVEKSEPMRRGVRNFVDLADLERKLNVVFAMTPAERDALGRGARAWYEAQHQRFEGALRVLVAEARSAAQ